MAFHCSQWSASSVAQTVLSSTDVSNEEPLCGLDPPYSCRCSVWTHVILPTQPSAHRNQPVVTKTAWQTSSVFYSGLLDDIDPSRTSTSPVKAPVKGGNLPTHSSVFTSHGMPIAYSTRTVFTAVTLLNGQVEKTTPAIYWTRTITAGTEVATQVGTPGAKGSPSGALIGAVVGATVIVILGSIAAALCILRHRRKRQNRIILGQVTPDAPVPRLSFLTETPVQEVLEINHRPPRRHRATSLRPHPFVGLEASRRNTVTKLKIKGKSQSSSLRGQDQNPFRDPEAADTPASEIQGNQQDEVQRARRVLNRLRQMTSQLEAELEQLDDLARPGQSSGGNQTEIRRTTGLTMPGSPRQGHLSTDTADSGSSTPPSYHSNLRA